MMEGNDMKKLTDDEFQKWAQVLKPCRYCGVKFIGPVCPCEREQTPSVNR